MNPTQAIEVYRKIIEQAMSNGMFKQLSQLDIAIKSLATLEALALKPE